MLFKYLFIFYYYFQITNQKFNSIFTVKTIQLFELIQINY